MTDSFKCDFSLLIFLYLPTFSGLKAWDFYPGSARISEDKRQCPKPPEDVRGTPEIFRTYPEPSEWKSFAKHDPVQNAFLIKTLRFPRKYRHLLILHEVFVSHIGLSLHIFGKCVRFGCKHSHFLARRKKLVRKRELAWDRSFQLAGVRLMPKAWELAGIYSSEITLLAPGHYNYKLSL